MVAITVSCLQLGQPKLEEQIKNILCINWKISSSTTSQGNDKNELEQIIGLINVFIRWFQKYNYNVISNGLANVRRKA